MTKVLHYDILILRLIVKTYSKSTLHSEKKSGSMWRGWLLVQQTLHLCYHWLSVYFWVQFKVLVLTFKALHGIGLGYFHLTVPPDLIEQLCYAVLARDIWWHLGAGWAFYSVTPHYGIFSLEMRSATSPELLKVP